MTLYADIFGGQITGGRKKQEDSFLIKYLPADQHDQSPPLLAVIADGMGGHAAGNVASKIAVSTFSAFVVSKFPVPEPRNLLLAGLKTANYAIAKAAANAPAFEGMGCTFVAVLIIDGQMWWVSVGDSNLYHVRGERLARKNLQHNFSTIAELLVKQGKSVEAFGKLSPRTLMSALTGRDISYVDCPAKPLALSPQDWLILSTDGMDSVGDPTIFQCTRRARDAKSCVAALIRAVEDIGVPQQDNTTLIVARLTEEAQETSYGESDGRSTIAGSRHPVMPDEFDL